MIVVDHQATNHAFRSACPSLRRGSPGAPASPPQRLVEPTLSTPVWTA
jgi:hypothetical protein